jgi:F-type H+-transporting ATPase subunit b
MIRTFTTALVTLAMTGAAFAAETAEAGHEPSVFNGTIAQSVAALLSFLILLAVLYVLAWKPILTGLQDREKKIKDDLEAAEAGAKRAKALVAEYEVKLAEAQTAAGKVIDQARADAERIAAQLKDRTQQDILQMKERAESDIRAAKEQALTEVYAQAATLSTQVASRILKREINAADQQTLVQASLDELVKRN